MNDSDAFANLGDTVSNAMVFRPIDDDLKERLIECVSNGYPMEETIAIFGVAESSYYRWRKNLEMYGSVRPPKTHTQGRPRLLHPTASSELYDLMVESPEMYLDEVQQWLILAHDIGMSKSALDQNLRNLGFTYKLLRKVAAERDEVARAAFRAVAREHWVGGQIVCVDESSKDDRTIYRHYGRSVNGTRAVMPAPFVRGTRYSFLAALTVDGYMAQRAVEGSVDGEEFFDFIVEEVLPRMNRWPGDNSILLMDNCSIHKTRALRTMVEGIGAQLVFLPAYSPDLNPIEESFSCLKAHMQRNWEEMQNAEDGILALYKASSVISGDLAKGWYRHSGYIVL